MGKFAEHQHNNESDEIKGDGFSHLDRLRNQMATKASIAVMAISGAFFGSQPITNAEAKAVKTAATEMQMPYA